jgi:Fe-S-cluster formation regulator IscX/YfhJ
MDQEQAAKIAIMIGLAWERVESLAAQDQSSGGDVRPLALAMLDLHARLRALEQVEDDRQVSLDQDRWYGNEGS